MRYPVYGYILLLVELQSTYHLGVCLSIQPLSDSFFPHQDLPNNMIHQVRMKSLPQEWLWCETWCSDASKAKAKTIDLVSSPNSNYTQFCG